MSEGVCKSSNTRLALLLPVESGHSAALVERNDSAHGSPGSCRRRNCRCGVRLVSVTLLALGYQNQSKTGPVSGGGIGSPVGWAGFWPSLGAVGWGAEQNCPVQKTESGAETVRFSAAFRLGGWRLRPDGGLLLPLVPVRQAGEHEHEGAEHGAADLAGKRLDSGMLSPGMAAKWQSIASGASKLKDTADAAAEAFGQAQGLIDKSVLTPAAQSGAAP